MSDVSAESSTGVWERRKLEAMSRIQRVALDLFEEHGYRAVTVERIANVARTSASSVYRYFGTKEMLVLYDEHDLRLLEEIARAGGGAVVRPAELIAAARALAPVLIEALLTPESELRLRRRMRYVTTIPEIADAQSRQMRETQGQVLALLLARTGRAPDDLRLGMAAAIAVWGTVAALDHWAAGDFARPLTEVYTETMAAVFDAIERIID
ncbi:TetR/AcrR family transcriptional regulator [Nocardia bovistercoris]|uniref:TetR family transcriptional regulator n=1 Tax=Nocardia bovistercoris TaxID=2785916 RepID=A0A931III8_9NOCA|nr:TetR/AcrR family transcriptional regulator [Nocardia bovistercoris]MBH0780243.1 TetR family transcriptional regulator [Nocardia bovistercoris]